MAETDTLSGIAVFVAAARAGNFTLAAEQLGITKSAVGKSIARLEERLGLKLFNRTTRRTTLTSDGEAYFAACSAAFDEIAATEAALTSRNRVIGGMLRLDMPVAFGRRILLPILLEIAKPHPRLSLTLSFTDAMVDPLHDDVDLVIRFGALPDTHGLIARRLASQRLMICAAPSYLQEHGVPQTVSDLAEHWNIVGMRKGPPVSWLMQENGSTKRITPPPTHQFSDGDAIIEAAISGFGICQLPASVVRRYIDSGALVPILEEHSRTSVDVHAVWARQGQLSPKVRYVVDRLVEYAEDGWLD
ncbi:LysR family transcriptional regulator [Roseinatronobacter sp. NSM]|uniref:LysR family transcriptional regulator n=1 Tax=Roseinatronobacter sp. NSM TaxID=3457785 RepID=UPI004035C2D5